MRNVLKGTEKSNELGEVNYDDFYVCAKCLHSKIFLKSKINIFFTFHYYVFFMVLRSEIQLLKCPCRLFIGCLIFLPFLVASRIFCFILVSSIIRVVLGMICECVSPHGFTFPQAHSGRFLAVL